MDNPNPTDQTTPEKSTTAKEKPGSQRVPELANDLRELADTLENAVRGLTNRERAKELEDELRRVLGDLRQQADAAMKQARVPEAAQDLGEQAKRVAGQAVHTRPAQVALGIIARGIAALNEQLQRYVETGQTEGNVPAPMSQSEVTAARQEDAPSAASTGGMSAQRHSSGMGGAVGAQGVGASGTGGGEGGPGSIGSTGEGMGSSAMTGGGSEDEGKTGGSS